MQCRFRHRTAAQPSRTFARYREVPNNDLSGKHVAGIVARTEDPHGRGGSRRAVWTDLAAFPYVGVASDRGLPPHRVRSRRDRLRRHSVRLWRWMEYGLSPCAGGDVRDPPRRSGAAGDRIPVPSFDISMDLASSAPWLSGTLAEPAVFLSARLFVSRLVVSILEGTDQDIAPPG